MWIRLEKQDGMYAGKAQYDGICEESDDLSDDEDNGYADYNGSQVVLGTGSMAFCLEDGKLYVKDADLSWQPAQPEEE